MSRTVLLRCVAGIAWLGAAGGGLAGLWRYSLTEGEMAEGKRVWPEASALPRAADVFSLVMFLHPECPCSRASLEELGVLLARHPGRFSVQLLFFTPEGRETVWSDTFLWRQARGIPGVRAAADAGGREAERFAARWSGETFVYDPGGGLVFHGGITAARGHTGDNEGLDAIGRLASAGTGGRVQNAVEPGRSPVYGCALREVEVTPETAAKRESPKG